MAEGSTLALIPARAGSRGLPGKNLRPFGGKPLIAWTIEAVLQAQGADRVVVSTDGEEIAQAAREAGAEVPWLRPAHLATDEATTLDVAFHALDELGEFDWLLLLQPTSPLRKAGDIQESGRLRSGADGVVSVCAGKALPLLRYEDENGFLTPVTDAAATRRQDMPTPWLLNGAIYWVRTEALRRERSFLPVRTRPYVMPLSRSVDIDDADDWAMAEALTRLKSE